LFLVSVTLAVVVGFALRYLLGLLAFWVVETAGFASLLVVLQIFCSGSLLPLVVFPDRLRALLEALPFRCMVQVPIDVLLREDTGTAALPLLALQLAWALGLLGLGAALTRLAVRLVVVHGG
jgi:ABC-2 type transport system permease protein